MTATQQGVDHCGSQQQHILHGIEPGRKGGIPHREVYYFNRLSVLNAPSGAFFVFWEPYEKKNDNT